LFQRIFVGILAGLRAFSRCCACSKRSAAAVPQNKNPQHPRSINLSTAGASLLGPILLVEEDAAMKSKFVVPSYGVSRRLLPVFQIEIASSVGFLAIDPGVRDGPSGAGAPSRG